MSAFMRPAFRNVMRRLATLAAPLLLISAAPMQTAYAEARHGIAMYGEPALPKDFAHLPFVNPDAPKGGRIVQAQAQSFTSINPLIVRGDAAAQLVPYVVQPLMFRSWDEPFTVYGLVAETVETPDDRSWVEFRLNPKAAFSDGKPVTTADVEFTFNLIKEKGRPLQRTAYGKVESVEVKDAQTIRFNMPAAKDRELPMLLALMPVLPKHAIDVATFDQPTMTPMIGSGPYIFDKIEAGTSISMKRNPNFWARDLPVLKGLYNADEMRFDYMRDENTLMEALKAGLYDIRVETSPARWQNDYGFVDGAGFEKWSARLGTPKGMSGLVFNTRKPVFADPKVRAALINLFDFEAVNKNLFGGVYTRTPSFFADSELSAFGHPIDDTEKAILGDVAASLPAEIINGTAVPPTSDGSGKDRARLKAAVAMLAEAGYTLDGGVMKNAKGEPLAFEIFVTTADHAKLGLAISDTAKLIGIAATVRQVESTQYWNSMKEFAFDTTFFAYGASASPGNEQLNRWSTGAATRNGSLNYAGVQDPNIDRVLAAMLGSKTREEWVSGLRALDRLLLAGNYMIPGYHLPESWIVSKKTLGRPEKLPTYQVVFDAWWVKQ